MFRRSFSLLLCLSAFSQQAWGGCMGDPVGTALADYADGIFLGAVVDQETLLGRDGRVWTHTVLRVDEVAKGTFPPYVKVSTLGGDYGRWGDYDSRCQKIGNWPRALFLVKKDGSRLALTQGLGVIELEGLLEENALASEIWAHGRDYDGGDFDDFKVESISQRVVTSTGYLGDASPSRLLWSDRGEKVPVLIDMDALPPGMSESEALKAVNNALAAWAAVSSLSFYVEDTVSFGQAANAVDMRDQRLRLQLHDLYGIIDNGSSTLGIGGRSNSVNLGAGGTVKGQAFNPTRRAYVVLDHDKSTLQNVTAFEEVLTHEIGHALGLAHSSETASETDPHLKEAIMYFRAKKDGRGASLGNYDIEKIRGIHPEDNTPPFGLARDLTMVTTSTTLPPYVNSIEIVAGDLQGDNLTVEIVESFEAVGSFSLNDNVLSITPKSFYSDADAGESSFYAQAVLRVSDGVNLSPTFAVRIRSMRRETGVDGLPDSWALDNFGTTNTSGNRGPLDDFDSDGWTNFQEFRWGLDPKVPDTLLTIDRFDGNQLGLSGSPGVALALYRSTDLTHWHVANLVSLASETDNALTVSSDHTESVFYRFQPID